MYEYVYIGVLQPHRYIPVYAWDKLNNKTRYQVEQNI